MPEQVLTGIPTAPGIAIGEVFLFRHDEPEFREFCILESRRDEEIARFEESRGETRRQLATLRENLAHQVGEAVARIFDAQIAILEDEEFIGAVLDRIGRDGLNAESVVRRTAEQFHNKFISLDEELFRQRAQDVRDVGRRLVKNLLGTGDRTVGPLDQPAVLVTDDLLPSDVVHLLRENVQAVATDLGGAASHTAIITRSLEVPAVVGLKELTRLVHSQDRIIVNGNSGKVIVRPSGPTVRSYRAKLARYEEYQRGLAGIERLPAVTLDDHRVALRANIELPREVDAVISHGAEGIGLFRSEYLFLARNRLPSEEEQIADYQQVIKSVAPHPVTIRTYDLGGDKMFPNHPHPAEANPFMGWRAVRVSLDQPLLLRTQLRAILRAAAAGPTRIMFPLISDLQEVRQVKGYLEEVKSELKEGGFTLQSEVAVGAMIELPSAAVMADKLAREVDFFSIGTNDLTQFTLAVDRGNERVRRLYRPLHPALIRMVRMTIEAGHAAGIEVAMCGELSASPLATMLLVGLGVDELSVSPVAVPEIKKIIRSMSYRDAVALAGQALELDTADELDEFCREEMKSRFADLPIWFSG